MWSSRTRAALLTERNQHRVGFGSIEMFGARAMDKDGWWASSRPDRLPWDVSPETLAQFGPDPGWDPDREVGRELYDLSTDFSQAHDGAADHIDKVQAASRPSRPAWRSPKAVGQCVAG